MAAGDILDVHGSTTAMTITLGSLANGSSRQTTMVDNSSTKYPGALIHVKLRSGGSAPTAGAVYEVFLLRRDDHASPNIADDNAGGSDAAITIENAPLLDTIVVTASTAKDFYKIFDTRHLGSLGKSWGIAIKNSSGQALDTTDGNHSVRYVGVYQNVASA